MIKHIVISNFKNFNFLKVNFEKFNIIKGKNGSGKTNLLEAIYISTNGHPFFRNFREIQRDKKRPAIITSKISNYDIMIKFDENGKVIKLNGKPTKVIDIKKMFPCIDYSINSFIGLKSKDYLFSLLDRGIFAIEEGIIKEAMEYRKLIKIKRELLKGKMDIKTINILNEKLKTTVDSISNKRKVLTDRISKLVHSCFFNFYKKELIIKYIIGNIQTNLFNKELQKNKILFSLKKDDFSIRLNGRDLRYSSVGERKIALLCIVLGILKTYNTLGRFPVFLVDDLEGDLDIQIQQRAFELIKGLPNQIFLTTLGAFKTDNYIDLEEVS